MFGKSYRRAEKADEIPWVYGSLWIDTGIHHSDVISSQEIKAASKKNPSVKDLHIEKSKIASVNLDPFGRTTREVIGEGGTVTSAARVLVKEFKIGLQKLAEYIRTHPDSSVGQSDYFIGRSRLASVSSDVMKRFGFKELYSKKPIFPHTSQNLARESYVKAGLSGSKSARRSEKRPVTVSYISRAELLELY